MSSEQSPQPDVAEAYKANYYELIELVGQLQATIAANYHTDYPRQADHIGKQEELKSMIFAVLEFAKEPSA